MADKLKKTLPVSVRFSDGELITGAKLNTVMSSLERSLLLLEKAIGDLDDQSYPYFESADTLSQASGRNSSEGTIGSDRKLEITNLARLIGPASALNPIHITDVSYAETQVVETIPSSGHVFVFKYVPNTSSDAPAFIDTAVFQTYVAGRLLSEAGEYSITSNGEVYTYSAMNGGTVTYYADVGMENTGDAMADPTWSTYNVIPDQNQPTKCTVVGPTAGLYTVTLPLATHSVVDDAGSNETLDTSDLSYGLRIRLPIVLQDLVSGTEIPEGFLYLRDDDTGEIYKDAQYYSHNTYEFKIGGATLDTAHSFTVLTVGSNITETLLDLKLKLWQHRRGRDTQSIYPASQIVKATGIGTDELYVPSEVPYNTFPQYLHRDGWFTADDDNNINDQNGMRGDLVLLASTRSSGSRNHILSDSAKLIFGSTTSGFRLHFQNTGPYTRLILNDMGNGYPFDIVPNVGVTGGVSAGETDPVDYLKWHVESFMTGTVNGAGSLQLTLSRDLSSKRIFGVSVVMGLNGTSTWYPPNSGASYGDYVAYYVGGIYNYVQISTGATYFGLDVDVRVAIFYADN